MWRRRRRTFCRCFSFEKRNVRDAIEQQRAKVKEERKTELFLGQFLCVSTSFLSLWSCVCALCSTGFLSVIVCALPFDDVDRKSSKNRNCVFVRCYFCDSMFLSLCSFILDSLDGMQSEFVSSHLEYYFFYPDDDDWQNNRNYHSNGSFKKSLELFLLDFLFSFTCSNCMRSTLNRITCSCDGLWRRTKQSRFLCSLMRHVFILSHFILFLCKNMFSAESTH